MWKPWQRPVQTSLWHSPRFAKSGRVQVWRKVLRTAASFFFEVRQRATRGKTDVLSKHILECGLWEELSIRWPCLWSVTSFNSTFCPSPIPHGIRPPPLSFIMSSTLVHHYFCLVFTLIVQSQTNRTCLQFNKHFDINYHGVYLPSGIFLAFQDLFYY